MILALADRQRQHVPYRQCKLTHVLRDSLQGNCATVMIANIWGELAHIEETVSDYSRIGVQHYLINR